jgi:hypothetical protein
MNGFPVFRLWEGDHMVFLHADGTRERRELKKLSATVTLGLEDIERPDVVLGKFGELAHGVEQQQQKLLFDFLNEATEEAGTVVEADGRPMSPDLFLDALGKIELGFNSDGTPHFPAVVCQPEMLLQLTAVVEQVQTKDPYKQRLEEILAQKRQAWRVRESTRKLVG